MKFLSKIIKIMAIIVGCGGSIFVAMIFNRIGYPEIGGVVAVCIGITALLIYSYGEILGNSIICREILQELKDKLDATDNASKESNETEQLSQ